MMSMMAQVQSETSKTKGAETKQVTVERGEVVYVSGNDLIIKMENGEMRHIPNVPESATATVDGKEIGIHDVKVGMKLQKTITTTSMPTVIQKVERVTGRVFHVTPPNSVVLTLANGTNQEFTIPKDQKFNIEGQVVDAFGLRPGMKISATKIVETPETVSSQKTAVTGNMPPPIDVPILLLAGP